MIHLQRIVPSNLVNKLKLQKFQIAYIQAKHANKVIQILKGLQTLPIDTFFLKRVRKNKQSVNHPVYVEVLLCLTEQKDQFIDQIYEGFKQTFQQNIIKQIITMQLPRFAPASKQDFQEWGKYWPCNYLQPEFMKRIDHTKQQQVIIQQLHKVAIHRKQTHNSFYLFTPQKYLIHFEGPKQSFSCLNKNPLQHPIIKIAQKWPQSQAYKKSENEYYYLTGLRMIVCSQKLCGMCAMALVHSRIERLYFESQSIPTESIVQILYNLKLNHKIDILKITPNQKKQNKQ